MRIDFIRLNSKISDKIAFIVLIIAGAAIAWLTINVGEKIINNAPNSTAFNLQKRIAE